jgi:hypothetical protein
MKNVWTELTCWMYIKYVFKIQKPAGELDYKMITCSFWFVVNKFQVGDIENDIIKPKDLRNSETAAHYLKHLRTGGFQSVYLLTLCHRRHILKIVLCSNLWYLKRIEFLLCLFSLMVLHNYLKFVITNEYSYKSQSKTYRCMLYIHHVAWVTNKH